MESRIESIYQALVSQGTIKEYNQPSTRFSNPNAYPQNPQNTPALYQNTSSNPYENTWQKSYKNTHQNPYQNTNQNTYQNPYQNLYQNRPSANNLPSAKIETIEKIEEDLFDKATLQKLNIYLLGFKADTQTCFSAFDEERFKFIKALDLNLTYPLNLEIQNPSLAISFSLDYLGRPPDQYSKNTEQILKWTG